MGESSAKVCPNMALGPGQAFSHVYSMLNDFAEVYRALNYVNDILSMFFKSDLCSGSRNTDGLVKMHIPRLHNLLG